MMPVILTQILLGLSQSPGAFGYLFEVKGACGELVSDQLGSAWFFDRWAGRVTRLDHAETIELAFDGSLAHLQMQIHDRGLLLLDPMTSQLHDFDRKGRWQTTTQLRDRASCFAVSGDQLALCDPVNGELRRVPLEHPNQVLQVVETDIHPIAVTACGPSRFALLSHDQDRVVLLDLDQETRVVFGRAGAAPGHHNGARDLAYFEQQLWLLDSGNDRIQVFSTDGQFMAVVGRPERTLHEGQGGFHDPESLAVWRTEGQVRVAVSEPLEARVQVLGEGKAEAGLLLAPRTTHLGSQIAAMGSLVAMADGYSGQLYLFDLSAGIPIHVNTWSPHGNGLARILRPVALCFESNTRLWVSDPARRVLVQLSLRRPAHQPLRFDPDLIVVRRVISWERLDGGSPVRLGTIRWDPGRQQLTAFDHARMAIMSISSEGFYVDERLLLGEELVDFAWNPSGTELAVLLASSPQLQVYDRDGGCVSAPTDDSWRAPSGLAYAPSGLVLTDAWTHRLHGLAGEPVNWPDLGRDLSDGALWAPSSVAVSERGVFVNDHGNHRAQWFTADGAWFATFGTGRTVTRNQKGGAR